MPGNYSYNEVISYVHDVDNYEERFRNDEIPTNLLENHNEVPNTETINPIFEDYVEPSNNNMLQLQQIADKYRQFAKRYED